MARDVSNKKNTPTRDESGAANRITRIADSDAGLRLLNALERADSVVVIPDADQSA